MQLIGIPKCPYCRKRVNLIRVWSLKKHGEYRCPRCRGISNIYLSPLIYVIAVVAAAAAFLIYFFARFISDTLNLITAAYVAIPFAAFFLLSLFFVYLEKTVVKRVKRTADGRYFDEEGNELEMRHGKLKPTGRRAEIQNIGSYEDRNYQDDGDFEDDADFDYSSVDSLQDYYDGEDQSSEMNESEFAPDPDYYDNSDYDQSTQEYEEDSEDNSEEELYAMAAREYMSSHINAVDENSVKPEEEPVQDEPAEITADDEAETPSESEESIEPAEENDDSASADKSANEPNVLKLRTIRAKSTEEIDRLFEDADMKIFGDKNDDSGEIKVGKVARQRYLENTQNIKLPPNSGFEDLFDDYK